MNRIKQLRHFFGYTQEKLAKMLNVGRSTVAMWETSSQEPDYETLKRLSQIFDIPPDFVCGEGIFENWDKIVEYYEPLSFFIINRIPSSLEMPSFCEDKVLIAWLDTRLYFEPDELQLARWFNFAVADIQFTPCEGPHGKDVKDVTIRFTPEFQALIDADNRREAGGHDIHPLSQIERDVLTAMRRYTPDLYFPELISLYSVASDRDRALVRQILSAYEEKNSPALPVDAGESVG